MLICTDFPHYNWGTVFRISRLVECELRAEILGLVPEHGRYQCCTKREDEWGLPALTPVRKITPGSPVQGNVRSDDHTKLIPSLSSHLFRSAASVTEERPCPSMMVFV